MSSRIRCFSGAAGMLLKRKRKKADTDLPPCAAASSAFVAAPISLSPVSNKDFVMAETTCRAKVDGEAQVGMTGTPTMSSFSTASTWSCGKDSTADDQHQQPNSPDPIISPSLFSTRDTNVRQPVKNRHSMLKSWTRQKQIMQRNHFGTKKRWVSVERASIEGPADTERKRILKAPQRTPEGSIAESAFLDTVHASDDTVARGHTTADSIGASASLTVSTVSQTQSSDSTCLDIYDDFQSFHDNRQDTSGDLALQQPGSTTSMALAVRFFEQLDSKHPLSVQESSPDTPPGSVLQNGRTRRFLTLKDPGVQQDYHAYSAMCNDAGVDPLVLNEFLAQRSLSRNYAYDGFLDE